MMSFRDKIRNTKPKVSNKNRATRLRLSSVLHVLFNVVLVALVYLLVVYWDLTLLAVVLVLLSKWRMIGVRPRFWWSNLRANLPDIIVGLSVVAWLDSGNNHVIKILVALSYIVWLLVIKPNTSDLGMMIQAGWSEFIGINTIFITISSVHETWTLILVWLVAWANARHFLGIFDDENTPLLAVIWATVIAELAWLSLQWLVIFKWPSEIFISQSALLIIAISYGLGGWYSALQDDDNKSDAKDSELGHGLLWLRYGLFSVGLVVLILFATWLTGGWSGGV